jgi:tetratricopeptide (TPR) repeat protein
MEPNWIDGMDQYAYLLQKQGNLAAVNRLYTDLFALSNNLPEPWVVLTISCLMKSDFEPALNHIENAIQLSPRHVFAYQIKGDLFYAMNKPGKACTAYRTAYRISRDFANFEGLVHCYIQLGKLIDATSTAKEALFLYPQSARAVCLAGIVMKENPSLVAKAKEYLEKALKIDPMLIEGVFALSDLYDRLEDTDKAIEILQKGASMHHTDSIHVKLGILYYKRSEYSQANTQFNAALSINPENASAKKGLVDVEKAINGRDEEDEELEESEGDLGIDAQSMEEDA